MAAGKRIVIVGAGLGGLLTAERLRALGHAGPIVMIGDEAHPPYDRPPLSKSFLRADSPGIPFLREVAEVRALDLDLRLSSAAVELDPDTRTVLLRDGTREPYNALVIATGASPRLLPGAEPRPGLHVLRTVGDAQRLADDIRSYGELIVVGGGFIGCEVAATARELGAEVTVIEALPAPLIRVAGPEVAAEVIAMHSAHGVNLRCDTLVTELVGGESVEGVRLSTGEYLPSRAVLVALGVAPALNWLAGSGIEVSDGVHCDTSGRTSIPDVYALGDVAYWESPRPEFSGRHEHWTTASDQAAVVAANLLAAPDQPPVTLTEVPYFWSDLYGVKVQALGWPSGDRVTVPFRSGKNGDRLVVVYGREGAFVGIVGFGVPRVVMSVRPLLTACVTVLDAIAQLSLTNPAPLMP